MPPHNNILEHTRDYVRKNGPNCSLNTRPIAEDLFRGLAILQTIAYATTPFITSGEEVSHEKELARKMIALAWEANDLQIDLAQVVFDKLKNNLMSIGIVNPNQGATS